MQETKPGNGDEAALLRQELALREREIERHRRSSSVRRDELKTKRLIAFLSLIGLLIAGGVAFLVVDLIMKKSTDRAIAIERERMLDRRKLAEHQAELDKAVAVARAEAESLQSFAAVAAGHDLITQIEMAKLQAEIATNEEMIERWGEIMTYLEERVVARREAFEDVEKKIAENRRRYAATVNEIINSRAPSAAREERLAKLDAELASLQVTARRLLIDLGGAPEDGNQPAKTEKKGSAVTPSKKPAKRQARANGKASGSLPLPQPRPTLASAALEAPTPLSPPDGSVFDHFPRQTIMSWSPVPGAVGYTVEVDCFSCCEKDEWCSDIGQEYVVVPGVAVTRYGINFGGHRQGRWRVWAVTADGSDGAKSDWSEFTYTE